MTCEGRYRLVFLYHLRLLMIFTGYPLNMPFYFHHSLYKMSKKFKRQKADNNLFHHGLIKLIVVYHLSFHGDSWRAFIARNGFEDTDPVQVDKPMVIETKAEPPVPLHLLLPKSSADPGGGLPDTVTKSAEAIKKPMSKKPKANLTTNAKGKRNA
jgi:hypothetical protein